MVGCFSAEATIKIKRFRRATHFKLGVSETGSAKMGSAIDVHIDDAGWILKFRIGFSP